MFIQGDLQAVFDALYKMGIIDPILKKDWQILSQKLQASGQNYREALYRVNMCGGEVDKISKVLASVPSEVAEMLAMEVARELAESVDRQIVH